MDDSISRQDVLRKARPEYLNPQQEKLASYNQGWNNALDEYSGRIKELPSTDRPIGKWIPKLSSEDKVRRYECSVCGYVHIKYPYTVEFYCPNCGAYMRGDTE